MQNEAKILTEVINNSDLADVKANLRNICSMLPVSEADISRFLVCGVEAATNIVKHSEGGSIEFRAWSDEKQHYLMIKTRNRFQRRIDFEEAITNGFSTAGSLGSGLGIINDIMDEMHFELEDNYVTMVFVKNICRPSDNNYRNPMDIGAASRAHPRMKVNGDAIFIKSWEHFSLLCIVDGLGHGQYASLASAKAIAYLHTHYTQSLSNIMIGMNRASRSTRGNVAGIIKIDWLNNKITYTGIGNIESKIYGYDNPPRFINRRGIVGTAPVEPQVQHGQWSPDGILLMYSDGISSSIINMTDYTLFSRNSSDIARYYLAKYSKPEDDASIIIAKGRKNAKN